MRRRLGSRRSTWLAVATAATLCAGTLITGAVATATPSTPAADHARSPQLEAEIAKSTPTQRAAARRVAAATAADETAVEGIDVSAQQHPDDAPIDWGQVAAAGYRFAGVKASEGDHYTNTEYFTADMTGARAAGMYAFAYHVAIPNTTDGATQASYFLDHAQYVPDGQTLNPALNIEWNPTSDGTGACYGLTPAQLVTWIGDFSDEVKRRAGVPATIYTEANWWNTCTGGTTAFAANPLWIASYRTTPTLPTGWPDWTLWEHGRNAVPGINAVTDVSLVNGGEPTLAALTTTPAGYTPVTPVRVLDTRNAIGVPTTTPLGNQASVTLDLSSRLPATATAAVLNVTGIATSATYVTVWQAATPRPNASNLNLVAGDIRPNLVTVQLGTDRKAQLYNHTASTHLLADLAGYYATDAPGLHTAHTPTRVLNTQSNLGAPGPLGAGTTVTLNLTGVVPADATAVTLNLTAVSATLGTYVTAWPTGQPRPNASNLNLTGANPTSNLITAQLGTNRSINLYNNSGTVHLLGDLAGHYSPTTGSRFVARPTLRTLDTRTMSTQWIPVTGGGTAVALDMRGPIPPSATAAVINITGIAPTVATYITASPKTSTTPTRPTTSNLNLTAGQTLPNLASVALGPNNDVWLFNNAGTINLVADLAGYFIP